MDGYPSNFYAIGVKCETFEMIIVAICFMLTEIMNSTRLLPKL